MNTKRNILLRSALYSFSSFVCQKETELWFLPNDYNVVIVIPLALLQLKYRTSWQRLQIVAIYHFIAFGYILDVRTCEAESATSENFNYISNYMHFQKGSPGTYEEYQWLFVCHLGYRRIALTAAPRLASSRTDRPSPTLQSMGYKGVNM